MKNVVKFIAIVGVMVFSTIALGLTIATGMRASHYMNAQHMNYSDAITWAKDDMNDWLDDIFGNNNKSDAIIEFGTTNEYVTITGCVNLK